MNTRQLEHTLAAQLLQTLTRLEQHLTVANERYVGTLVNHVLEVRTYTFDSTGKIALSWGIPAGSIEVDNLGTAEVAVESGAGRTSAPTDGMGVSIVPAGSRKTVNLASARAVLWGTNGQRVSIQAFSTGTRGNSGLGAVNGGTP